MPNVIFTDINQHKENIPSLADLVTADEYKAAAAAPGAIAEQWLGRRRYHEVWEMQKQLFNELIDRKRSHLPVMKEYILGVEHEPVITLGRHAHESNLLVSAEILASRDIDLVRIERGGDITYHGPGQLVVYPILDLERHGMGIKDYVYALEQCVIDTIADYGIRGERVEGANGVWIGKGTANERKICAIGVKSSRYVTMHGLALNVTTDLSPFSLINPCGFTDKGVTSMLAEISPENNHGQKFESSGVTNLTPESVAPRLFKNLKSLL